MRKKTSSAVAGRGESETGFSKRARRSVSFWSIFYYSEIFGTIDIEIKLFSGCMCVTSRIESCGENSSGNSYDDDI